MSGNGSNPGLPRLTEVLPEAELAAESAEVSEESEQLAVPQWASGEFFFALAGAGFVLLFVVGFGLGMWFGPVVPLLGLGAWLAAYFRRPRKIRPAVAGGVPDTKLIISCTQENGLGGESCHLFVMTDMLHVWQTGGDQHHRLMTWIAGGGVPDRENHAMHRFAVKEIAGIVVQKKQLIIETRTSGSGGLKTTTLNTGPHALAFIRPLAQLGWRQTVQKDGIRLSSSGRSPQTSSVHAAVPA